jgi:hypothetical protein
VIAGDAKGWSPRVAWAVVSPFWGWTLACALRRNLRWDHVALAVFATVLAASGARSRRVLQGLLPMGLVALFYDGMRLFKNAGLTSANVHICDLRAAEARFFGVSVDGVRGTVHDWLQRHATLGLDVFAAVAYGSFLLVVLLYAVSLLVRDFAAGQRFMWGFFLLNMVGFATYHIYPAAPPWYYHAHGCVADLAAKASAGPNLTRVDALLGVSYFGGLYGRSSDVFGAVPSLHVAYPLLMVLEGWPKHRTTGRGLLVAFYLWMCFSAVYLDHHWIIDVLLGSAYAALIALLMRMAVRWSDARQGAELAVPRAMRSRWQS